MESEISEWISEELLRTSCRRIQQSLECHHMHLTLNSERSECCVTRLWRAGIDSVVSALCSVSCQTVLMGTPPINCGQVRVQEKGTNDRIHG